MLDVLLRSLGLDKAKMDQMMSNAENEYRTRIAEIHQRFDSLETLLNLTLTKLERIENGRTNAGIGATQQQFIDSIGADIVEPVSGAIQPISDSGPIGGATAESADA